MKYDGLLYNSDYIYCMSLNYEKKRNKPLNNNSYLRISTKLRISWTGLAQFDDQKTNKITRF